MELAKATPEPVLVARLGEACGLGARRATIVAALLESMHVAERRGGKVRKTREFASDEAWNAFLGAYERRHEGDKERLEAVMRYAQTGLCRMQYLREYFGEDAGRRCGHCDNCRDRPALEAEARASELASEVERSGITPEEVAPAQHEAAFAQGETVRHRRFGLGEVRRVEGSKVVVAFPRGEKKVQASFLHHASAPASRVHADAAAEERPGG